MLDKEYARRRKKYKRSSKHHKRLAELDTVHNQAFTDSPPPSNPPPPLPLAGSPSPSPPPPPRAVRCLNITIETTALRDAAALDAERIASLERDKAALERNVAALTAQ